MGRWFARGSSFTEGRRVTYFLGECFLGGWDLALVSDLRVLLIDFGELVPCSPPMVTDFLSTLPSWFARSIELCMIIVRGAILIRNLDLRLG